jgi:hypothetical protein
MEVEDKKSPKKKAGRKPVEKGEKKKQPFWCLRPSRELTAQPNQEGSEGRPLNHMNLRKGSTYLPEV